MKKDWLKFSAAFLMLLVASCASEPVKQPLTTASIYRTKLPLSLSQSVACVSKNIDTLEEFNQRISLAPKQRDASIKLSISSAPNLYVLDFKGNNPTSVSVSSKAGRMTFNTLIKDKIEACRSGLAMPFSPTPSHLVASK